MKFVTYIDPSGVRRPGFIEGERVVSLDCESLTECAGFDPEQASLLAIYAASKNDDHALADVTLCAPLTPLKNIFCVGRNYLEHAKEGARAAGKELKLPDVPTFFTKAPTAVADPDATLHFDSRVSKEYDWEGELAVVIGTQGRDIDEARALEHVFGYTIVNDITARDLQRAHLQWFKGKSLDESCPIGPWIVTPDEVGDPQHLHIELRLNGVVKQSASTSSMIFPVARIIAALSRGMTLEAGDIIATGTPEGVGFARNPPEFFSHDDLVEIEIQNIGVLRNKIAIT
ncbi:MAG: fumarylacetoacetate hydrolase family protein [Candidatus Eremiobacteraeota bacterium]|nr:fumarylacetoacetate hydrolase family protein [Candidatus Eremiobacteraeota bacterium]